MKYLIAIFTALVMVLASLSASPLSVPASSQQLEGNVRCVDKHVQSKKTVNDGTTGDDEWYLKVVVNYRYCTDTRGPDWVKPRFAIGSYNQEGGHMSCNFWTAPNRLKFVKFNMYFWDSHGRNFNPSQFYIDCDESTYDFEVQRYSENTPRLLFGDGPSPKWKSNVRIEKAGAFGDADATLSGRMTRHGM